MNPELKKISKKFEQTMINSIKNDIDPFIMVIFWYSLFRLAQRNFIKKIDIHLIENVNFYKDNVKGKFKLEIIFLKLLI